MLNERGRTIKHAITEPMATFAYGLATKHGLALARDPGHVFESCAWSVSVARVSHAGNTADCQRSAEHEGAGAPHPRRQAGPFRHMVCERPSEGLLQGKGLRSGRTHGARADQPGHQDARWA